jgi:hypothetical protein
MALDFKKEDKKIFDKYCKKYKYYPLIFPAHKRIIAIGDLHGDYNLTINAFKLAKLIDDNNKWIGGDTYVVQTGDQLDGYRPLIYKSTNKGGSMNDNIPEDIKVLQLMTDLNEQAMEKGGLVISLFGNHEIMNVVGDMRYVSSQDIQKFKNYKDTKDPLDARRCAFVPGSEFANLMACTRIPAVIIGSFIFVHAGLIDQFLKMLNIKDRNDLYKISYFMRKWLLGLIDKNYVSEIVGSKESLFWDRILGSIPPNMNNNHPKCVEYLDDVLKLFKVDKMIIGHTPQYFINQSGINKTCDDKLWRIDFGGSFAFDNFDMDYIKTHNKNKLRNVQVLEILDDKIINIIK